MSGFSSLLDANGNINTQKLANEVSQALNVDIKYKQVDNMKKRAVKTAASYDEFKAMVSCAHLKKVTRKEVESLSQPKKGWQKRSATATTSDGTDVLLDLQGLDAQNEQKNKDSLLATTAATIKPPKTCSELDRNLRRLISLSEKWHYLSTISLVKIEKVLMTKGVPDVDLIETFLIILLHVASASVAAIDNQQEGKKDSNVSADIDLLSWFVMLSELEKFSLTMRFLDDKMKREIQEVLVTRCAASEELMRLYQ